MSKITSDNMQSVSSNAVAQAISQITETNIIYDTSITDCNNAYQKGKTVTYCLAYNTPHVPNANNGWYIISQCNPTSWGTEDFVMQIATNAGSGNSNVVHTRKAYRNNGVIVWGPWVKLISSDDINIRGMIYNTGLLELNDNQEKTVTLNSSRMYLFINIHAVSGQELVILNCYGGTLRQTRISHAYDNRDTVITNSGQNVTFKADGGCRGHLLALTDYTST